MTITYWVIFVEDMIRRSIFIFLPIDLQLLNGLFCCIITFHQELPGLKPDENNLFQDLIFLIYFKGAVIETRETTGNFPSSS